MIAEMSKTHKGRWGFYPCSYELYRKLKRLNFLAFMARRRLASWERWNRKEPQNRMLWQKQLGPRGWIRKAIGPRPEPIVPPFDLECYDRIYADYRKARYPVASEEMVKPLILSETKIDAHLRSFEEWFARK